MGTTNILDLNNRLSKVEKENVAQNSYTSLKNKPKINSVTLTGNKSLADIGAAAAADVGDKTQLNTTDKSSTVAAINEVNGKIALKSNALKVVTKNAAIVEIPASTHRDFTADITESGYTALGIVGVSSAGSSVLSVMNFSINSQQTLATVRIVNNSASALTPTQVVISVLYIKND